MRNATLTPDALEGMADWAKFEPKMLKRIFRIFEECCRTPFDGFGVLTKHTLLRFSYFFFEWFFLPILAGFECRV
jgi:Txe/YoeB family toxin of Txe-Axe toxin-antitoxin module